MCCSIYSAVTKVKCRQKGGVSLEPWCITYNYEYCSVSIRGTKEFQAQIEEEFPKRHNIVL